jgi:hypothetical protein
MRMNISSVINPVNTIEMEEVIQKLKEHGYTELVECLMDNEDECYTKKGRLNKSATGRKLGWKSKQLEDSLKSMKELLEREFGD